MQRYARELLFAFDEFLERRSGLTIRLVTPTAVAVPVLRHIRHEAVGRWQGHMWEQFELPRFVGDGILFCPGNTAPVRSLIGSNRVVVTVHDLSYLYFPEAYSRAFKLLYGGLIPLILRRADRVITVSRSEQAAIVKHYPFAEGRLVAIQNGGLPTGIEEQAPQPSCEPTVLYVGSLSKRKNFPAMLEAAISLARRRGTHFAFVGGIPHGLSASLADVPADVRDRIHLHGQVNDWEVLLNAYRSAHCFLFPSFYEASPLPPIEAMACGCPVIAGDIPSLRERCEAAAHYCDPEDVNSMIKAVDTLLDNPSWCEELRMAGYQQAKRYNWITCAESTIDAILTGV